MQVTCERPVEFVEFVAEQGSAGGTSCIIDDNLNHTEAKYSLSNGLDIFQIKNQHRMTGTMHFVK